MQESILAQHGNRFIQSVIRASSTRTRHCPEAACRGSPLLAGTDTPAGVNLTPGISLHLELQRFVAAGLTPLEALQTATINPARFYGKLNEFGSIQAVAPPTCCYSVPIRSPTSPTRAALPPSSPTVAISRRADLAATAVIGSRRLRQAVGWGQIAGYSPSRSLSAILPPAAVRVTSRHPAPPLDMDQTGVNQSTQRLGRESGNALAGAKSYSPPLVRAKELCGTRSRR